MQNKVHVVHLTTHLGKGGAATNVLLSALGLSQRGYSVSVVHGPQVPQEETLIRQAKESGVIFHPIPSLGREIHPKKDLDSLKQIRACLGHIQPDLLHTHQSKAGVLGRWAAKKNLNLPVVHTPHGHVFQGYFPAWKTRLFMRVERQAAKWCERLVGLTNKEVEDHLERGIGNPEQWCVIPSGVPVEEVVESARSPLEEVSSFAWPVDSKVYLSIGRLEPIKGFGEFLPTLVPVFEKQPDLHWIILGEGGERQRIEETIRSLGLEKRIHLPGWVDNPYPFLARSKGLWVPSRNEGMGRVLVEAYALGKPVFAAKVGSLPEMVPDEDHGILFDWDDPERVSRSLSNFIQDLTDTRESVEKRKKTAERYSVERMLESLDRCYQTLLKRA